MSSDTPFLIASITKPMTAVGMMVLADRGELSLGDPVHKFIPEFQDGDRKSISIQNLLTHTSGLPDQLPENVEASQTPGAARRVRRQGDQDSAALQTRDPRSIPEHGIFAGFGGCPANHENPLSQVPRAGSLPASWYGRHGAGAGTDRAFRLAAVSGRARRCALWRRFRGHIELGHWNSPYWRNLATPWGGAHSTAPDIAKMLDSFLHRDGKVVKPETASSMIVDQNHGLNEPWGIGFSLKPGQFGRECSPRTFGHGGSTGTIAWADPEADRVCVLLTTLPARVSSESILRPGL